MMGYHHGRTKTPLWRAYFAMKGRCYQTIHKDYPNYGGRGIVVCDRWLFGAGDKTGIELFMEDMGERPTAEHTLDRINTNGNYEPSNCRWATRQEQVNNRRCTIWVEGFTLRDIADANGLQFGCVKGRYYQEGARTVAQLGRPSREVVRR